MRDKIAHGVKTELSSKRIEMERRILKNKISRYNSSSLIMYEFTT
jgi:hypothetical protein